ncbi:MAG: hypothetical protein LBB44_05190 [Endomicrobium sp.]|jgi:hypothetical protein|nr:hypothetical protein [Endomicrobium sp.]
MNKQDQKEITRKLRKKYGHKYRQNYQPTMIYMPKRVKEEIEQYCKEKGIAKSTRLKGKQRGKRDNKEKGLRDFKKKSIL